jgi:hypothetical protein
MAAAAKCPVARCAERRCGRLRRRAGARPPYVFGLAHGCVAGLFFHGGRSWRRSTGPIRSSWGISWPSTGSCTSSWLGCGRRWQHRLRPLALLSWLYLARPTRGPPAPLTAHLSPPASINVVFMMSLYAGIDGMVMPSPPSRQFFTVMRSLDTPDESGVDRLCEGLCQYLSTELDGIWQADGQGLKGADGTLLLQEY